MRLLVTRPQEDAERSAERLRALGHTVEIEPLLDIRYEPQPLPLDGVQALLISSVNGLRAYLASGGPTTLPVLAVGPASAEAARAAGFPSVRSADSDATALAKLTIATLSPRDGALLHPAGSVTASGLKERLGPAGFELRRIRLYDAVASEQLSERTQELLRTGALQGVLLYSPRTAATFAALVRKAGLEGCCAGLVAFCLSPAVAAALEGLSWRRIRVATAPQEPALIQAIEADQDRLTGSDAMAEDENRAREAGGGPEVEATNAAERLIARFGGLRPMASKLGLAVSTVQGWKVRGHIPATRTEEIRKAAAAHDITLDEAELAAATAEQPVAGAPEEPEATSDTRPWGAVSDEVAVSPDNAEPPETAEPAGPAEPTSEEAPEAPSSQRTKPPVPAPGAEPRRRGGAGGLIGGLLLGLLLVAVGAGAAVLTREYWQPYLEARLPGIEERIQAETAPLRERIEQLESAPAPEASGPDPAALEQQLGELRDRVSSLAEQGATAPEGGPDLTALQERVTQLESRVESAAAAAPEGLDELKQEVARLRDALAAAGGDPQAIENFRNQVATLNARFDELGGTVESLRQAMARVEVLQQELGGTKQQLEGLEQRMTGLDRTVQENAQASEQAAQTRNRGALLALALGQLREALRFSEPYAEALQSVRAVAEGQELGDLIEPLQARAESGVPNLTALRRRFAELAPEIVGSSYASGEQGWLRELMQRVPELVTVRPVGQAQGDSPGAKVARAEQALAAGDLLAAVQEVESLEGEAAEAAKPWLDDARARLAVEEAVSALTRRAVSQLSGPAGSGS